MQRFKKIFFRLFGGLAALAVVLIGLVLMLPLLFDAQPLKTKILADFKEHSGWEVTFDDFDLSLLPPAHALFRHVRVSYPGKLSGTVDSLLIYPQILPLFTGKILPREIRLEAPRISVQIPLPAPAKPDTQAQGPSWRGFGEKFGAALAAASSDASGMTVSVAHGSLDLLANESPFLQMDDISGKITAPGDDLRMDMMCKCNLSERVSFSARLDPHTFKGKGRLSLAQFRPHLMTGFFFPETGLRLGDSQIDLDLSFESNGTDDMSASFSGALPYLTFTQDHEKIMFRGDNLAGTLKWKEGLFTASISSLHLEEPRLDLTGTLSMGGPPPRVRLALEGSGVDAAAARKTALGLWGKHRTARKIFNVVRGGTVPHITYEAWGRSLRSFRKSNNFLIRGSMRDGVIFIPKVELEVEGAGGDVVISRGVLQGTKLVGRTGNSLGRDGTLTLALKRDESDDGPFHLDIDLDADLAELPPVLARTVGNGPFLRELALIKDVRGRAKGRLLLGETLKSVHTRVDAGELALHARYQRIPYPVELSGGPFLYEGSLVSAGSLSGKLGGSTFSEVAVALDWGDKSTIQASTTRRAAIVMDEIYPWLTSFQGIRAALKDFPSLSGRLTVGPLDLQGPFKEPRRWQFKVKGAAESFRVQSPRFPGPLTVKRGDFSASHEELTFSQCSGDLLDATFDASGSFRGYLSGPSRKDLLLRGTMGADTNHWLSDLASLPSALRVRSPGTVSNARVTWEEGGKVSVSGTMTVENGPQLTLDASKDPGRLAVRKLSIRDKGSDAGLSVVISNKQIDLGFSGTLGRPTLDGLLQSNDILKGWVKGDFQARIDTDHPLLSTGRGSLQADGITYTHGLDEPVEIKSAELSAQENKLMVKSAVLNVRDDQLAVKGSVGLTEGAFQLDLDVSTPELHWGTQGAGHESTAAKETKNPVQSLKYMGVPLRGGIRFSSDSFTYNDLTWKPFRANIFLLPSRTSIDVVEAVLCGIPTPGKIEVLPDKVRLDIRLNAKERALDKTLGCLWGKSGLMDGTFSLAGDLTANAARQELTKSFHGKDLELKAQKGRIYRMGLLTKIFAILNFTEIYRGKVPDLVNEGFEYDAIHAKGTLEGRKLTLESAVLSAPSMKMVGQGEIDLAEKKVDCTVLVAPLRTLDRIVSHVPILGKALGGTVISIPVRVSGDLSDPDVVPLSPSTVGSELLGFMKRTLQLPFRVIEPLWK